MGMSNIGTLMLRSSCAQDSVSASAANNSLRACCACLGFRPVVVEFGYDSQAVAVLLDMIPIGL